MEDSHQEHVYVQFCFDLLSTRHYSTDCVTGNTEEVGHAPNCIMVEAINQSGARIFLGVNLEEIVARGMKKISLRVFSALTSLVI